MARIAAELTTSLLGEQLVFGQRPVALTANVSFDALARPDGQFDLPALRRVIDEARSLISVPDDPKLALAALMEGVQHLSIRPLHLDGDGMAAPGAVPSAMGVAGDDGDTAIAPPKGHWVQMAASQRKAAREWQCFRAGSETRDPGFATEAGPDLSGGARVSVVWRPTWIDARQGVAAYQARVLRVDAEGMLPREGAAAYATNSSSSLLAIDRQVVAATVNVLRSRELGPIGLVLPICWNSLSLDRWSLIGPIADLPTAVRRDNLRIELIHLPGSVAADELKDALAFLRGIGSETLVRLRPSAAPVGMMAAAKAKMIGLDLGELSQDEQMGDEDMLANLDRFRQMAARRGLGSYLWSVRRRRLLVGAILCGYNMANGPGLLKDLGQPAAFIPASRTDLAAAV